MNVELFEIFSASLYILAILLIPLGMAFILIPDKTLSVSKRLNKWISTENLFNHLNQPRYKERFIYRHHRLFGAVVIVLTGVCLYMMMFFVEHQTLVQSLSRIAETEFGEMVVVSLFYSFIIGNILAMLIGFIIFIRPSALKPLERLSNIWIDTDNKMKVLDDTRDIPESVFHKYPRIFGILIIFGALWMMLNITSNFI